MPTTGLTLRQLTERDERVFPSYPQVSRYFPAKSIEDARARLGRSIERGDGPGLVIGGPGTGKSLLLQVLAAQFHERFDVVLPACARLCTRRALLQSILFELGLPYRSRDEGELRLSLLDHLLSREDCPTGLLLLVDEAQTLPLALLDELRVLTNLVHGALPRVRLVLAGSSSLEECFADPELESFSQRLSARCYLGPFTREETTQFVRAQVAACRATPEDIFSGDAWAAVFDATDGVPRLVNQLCDRALTEAIDAGRKQIDRSIIQAAWSDLQQLPTPWDTPEAITVAQSSQVIEFGNLASENCHEPVTIGIMKNDENETDSVVDASAPEFDTELDNDNVEREDYTFATSAVAAEQSPVVVKAAQDPFAEKYDEEEVVLDNFAAWDEMFRNDTPRVANRRNPELSTLVGAAIKALPDAERRPIRQPIQSLVESDRQQNIRRIEEIVAETAQSLPEANTNWPPLRIAEVSDTPSMPSQLMPPPDEEPVLIIEDDAAVLASATAPVRRHEYRHLFSRLRSG